MVQDWHVETHTIGETQVPPTSPIWLTSAVAGMPVLLGSQMAQGWRGETHNKYGGDASSVDLTNLVDISCGRFACVARTSDGTGVAWGNCGTNTVDLTDLADISCGSACVARKSDGTGMAEGHPTQGGDASSVDLTILVDISCGQRACVARKSDGTGLAWGDYCYGGGASSVDQYYYGGDPLSRSVSSVDLTDLVDIVCADHACFLR